MGGDVTISELLVPLDGSVRSIAALRVAEALSSRVGVGITAVSVSSPTIDCAPVLDWLDHRAAQRGAATVAIVADDVAGSLLELIGETPGIVPCMTSHGRTGLGQMAVGSVSAEVVRRSPRPVLLVGPRACVPATFATVGVCVHGPPAGVGEAAREWATALGAAPWLIAVQERDEVLSDDSPAGAEVRTLQAQLAVHGIGADAVVRPSDDPATAILDHVRRTGAALLIAATAARRGAGGVLLGSVAMRLVREAPCPVLLVGPAGQGAR